MTEQEVKFTNIVKETKSTVLSAISRTLRPEFYNMIDDVVQETYLRAYNSLKKDQFRNESSLNTWLYTIARNEALRLNKKMLKRNNLEQELNEEIITNTPDQKNTQENHESGIPNRLEILSKVMNQLPIKYKNVLELDILGLKDWQIAERLKISVGTVKSRNSRAREKVRQWIHQMKLT